MSTNPHEEYRRAVAARNRVILLRNLVSCIALIGGAGIGVAGLLSKNAPDGPDGNAPTSGAFDLSHVSMSSGEQLPEPTVPNVTVLANWKGKGASLHGTASQIAGKLMRISQNPADQVEVNREWDNPEVMDRLLPKQPIDPGVADLRLDTLQEKSSSVGVPRNINDAESLLQTVPASARAGAQQAFERIRAGHDKLTKARETGNRRERDGLLNSAKDDFRGAIADLSTVRDGPPRVEVLSYLIQYVQSCISDCNKSLGGG